MHLVHNSRVSGVGGYTIHFAGDFPFPLDDNVGTGALWRFVDVAAANA